MSRRDQKMSQFIFTLRSTNFPVCLYLGRRLDPAGASIRAANRPSRREFVAALGGGIP